MSKLTASARFDVPPSTGRGSPCRPDACSPARRAWALARCVVALAWLSTATASGATIDTVGTSAMGSISPFGKPSYATFGQTFVAPVGETHLGELTFWMQGGAGSAQLQFSAYVVHWNGTRATGPILYESPVRTGSPVSGMHPYIFGGNAVLTPGLEYIAFLSISEYYSNITATSVNTGLGWMGQTYAGGALRFLNNGADATLWTTTAWAENAGAPDLAFKAVFDGRAAGLGDLAGGTLSSSSGGVSNGGTVATGAGQNASGQRTFVWTLSDGMRDISPSTGSRGNGVSADGSTIVGGNDFGTSHAFRHHVGTGVTTFLPEIVNYNTSLAYGVSANGAVVVGFNGTTTNGADDRAVLWQGGTVTALTPSNVTSRAYGISGDGTTAVGDYLVGASSQAFRWTQATGYVALANFAGVTESHAGKTSGNGSVIGGYAITPAGQQAFRWTQAGGMVGLGDFAGGTLSSSVSGVSGAGDVLTGYGNDAGGQKAMVWEAKNGMRQLQSVLASEYGVDFTGWTLRGATISADASAVSGTGIDPLGNTQAWVAQINSRTHRFVSGETYAGFHTSKLGGLGTTVDLLGGTAGGARTVTVDLLAMPSVQFAGGFASDVVDVSGTGTDTFVLRLGYDEAMAISLYGAEIQAQLGWFDEGTNTWKSAVLGNTGGTAAFKGNRGYNAGLDTLGSYGVDTANNQVWAVINHNSDFATVPEPSTALLLAGASLGFLMRRRARS